VNAVRVAYTGELGWELHHPMEMQTYLWDQLMAAGEAHGLKPVGARAQNWLRQEKSYRAFGSDLGRDATPLESALDRFIDMDKDFRGKSALEKQLADGVKIRCVTVLIDGPSDADPWGREAIYAEDGTTRLGRLTSGGYSVHFGKQIGIGYVAVGSAEPGTKVKVKMLNQLYDGEVTVDSPYDPKNETIRVSG
ncbi:MAG: glycine cleavage T C-terminal barrel domain-containing protein, partial [Pseudomonadota bacterium]